MKSGNFRYWDNLEVLGYIWLFIVTFVIFRYFPPFSFFFRFLLIEIFTSRFPRILRSSRFRRFVEFSVFLVFLFLRLGFSRRGVVIAFRDCLLKYIPDRPDLSESVLSRQSRLRRLRLRCLFILFYLLL